MLDKNINEVSKTCIGCSKMICSYISDELNKSQSVRDLYTVLTFRIHPLEMYVGLNTL